jgi:hypothetical protein
MSSDQYIFPGHSLLIATDAIQGPDTRSLSLAPLADRPATTTLDTSMIPRATLKEELNTFLSSSSALLDPNHS